MKKTTLALLLSAILSASATAEESQQQPNIVNITINNVGEESGLEMGTGSRARGTGSIATGKNSVALGKNAVATGGNETQSSINAKLAENKQKLADIASAEANTNRLLDELQNIRKVEADVIEAGERVKQVRLAKQSAYNVWQEKLKTYHDTVANSTQELQQAQAKIDDLNSRLTGVSRIGGVDISSEEGLTHAATQLKSIAEEDTTLNLSVDFYKDYVSSYYQALGDIRKKEITYKSFNSSTLVKRDNFSSSCSIYRCIDARDYINEQNKERIKNTTAALMFVDFDTIISQQEWDEAQKAAPVLKEFMVTYYADINEPFVTEEILKAAVNYDHSLVDIYLKRNEIAYYQGQYEATKNTSWLDKKAKALNEFTHLEEQTQLIPNPLELKQALIKQWYADNITSIKERNTITTNTLTSELEKALGINKHATEEKQAQLARLKTEVEQAKSAYDNTNPSQADIALSQRYEQIMGQLTAKANELKSEQERLQALRHALTLHDLTNVGENAYAIGTNALATGKNSLAIGTDTIATGENSIAIGTGHNVLGNNSGAFGDPDYIYGDGSYAFGNNNTIGEATNPHNSGNNTFVLGSNVVTKANNAVILGANSTDGGDNTVSVGSSTAQRKIVYIANGAINQTSKDAINGSQIYDILQNATDINVASWQAKLGTGTNTAGNTGLITGDTLNDVSNKANRSANNLTAQDVENWQAKLGTNEVKANSKQLITSGAVHSYMRDMNRNTLAQANTYTDMRINGLKQHTDKKIKQLKEETRAGIASAMAMGAIPTVSNKRYSVGAGTATFRGESAVAISLRVRSDKDNAIVSFSASASSNGDIAGAAGFAFGF